MKGCKIIDIKRIVETDGTLLVMEEKSPIPFEIKRIFMVTNVAKGKTRGDHATKKTKLILFPVAGSCTVVVDNGSEKEFFLMNDISKGLYIDELLWRSMQNFTDDCVMMAVCDRTYTPGNETYETYDEYLNAIGKK